MLAYRYSVHKQLCASQRVQVLTRFRVLVSLHLTSLCLHLHIHPISERYTVVVAKPKACDTHLVLSLTSYAGSLTCLPLSLSPGLRFFVFVRDPPDFPLFFFFCTFHLFPRDLPKSSIFNIEFQNPDFKLFNVSTFQTKKARLEILGGSLKLHDRKMIVFTFKYVCCFDIKLHNRKMIVVFFKLN